MSTIEKLLIRGIRSFDPQSQHVIEFYTPLTVIVGPNGSGKTTIIECLKYATIGDLPPNSKGGAFIHDPRIAGETEVKAQIRLKFRNIRGKLMIITRSLQLTRKRIRSEMRTLESLLVTRDQDTGEQISLSSKCAELDTEIPINLGVCRAVLDNVIFCHQEDSNWPLSEPAMLKKRFDEIFSATKYSKALEELRSIRKTKSSEIKLEAQKLEFLAMDVDKAEKHKMQLQETREKLETTSNQAISLKEQIERQKQELDVLERQVAEGRHLEQAADRLKHAMLELQQEIEELQNSMDECRDEGRARQRIEERSKQLRELEAAIEEHGRNREEYCSRIQTLRKEQIELQAKQEVQVSRMQDQQKTKSEYQQFTKQIQAIYKDESNVEASLENELQKVISMLNAETSGFQRIEEEHDAQDGKNMEKRGCLGEGIRITKEQLKIMQDELEQLGKRMEVEPAKLDQDEEKLRIKHLARELELWNHKCEQGQRERQELEVELGLCVEKLNKQGDLAVSRARIQIKRNERYKQEMEISKKICRFFGNKSVELIQVDDSWIWESVDGVEWKFDGYRLWGRDVVQKLRQQVWRVEEIELWRLEQILQEQKRADDRKKELQAWANIIQNVDGRLAEAMQATDGDWKDHECLLCKHRFESGGQARDSCRQFCDLFRLGIEMLGSLDPKQPNELNMLEERERILHCEHNIQVQRLERVRHAKEVVEGIGQAQDKLFEFDMELETIENEIATEMNEVVHHTTKDVQTYMEDLNRRMVVVQKNIERFKNEAKRTEQELAQAERNMLGKENILANYLKAGQEFRNLEARIVEKQQECLELECRMEEIRVLVDQNRRDFQQAKKNHRCRNEQLAREKLELEKWLEKYRILCTRMQSTVEYDIFDYEEFVMKLELDIQEIQDQVDLAGKIHEQRVGIMTEIRQLEQSIQKSQRVEHMIAQRTALGQEIEEVEEQLILKQILQNKKRQDAMRQQVSSLECQKSHLDGEIKVLRELVQRYVQEECEYKDIQERHHSQAAKVRRMELVIGDIDKYCKALDNGIIKFHVSRMEEINRLVRELWTNTYQGTDIETIEIRADGDPAASRSYNYRVVMIKGNVELDMRGRCSAGQRVLASIVIRLALAETFGSNCGILTLDEPTTNLDRDNISSLAQSLLNLIQIRRKQANFQLVVITHDEDFVGMLGQSQENCWKVSKPNGKHSIIQKHGFRS